MPVSWRLKEKGKERKTKRRRYQKDDEKILDKCNQTKRT
jgi:hypothetical protein